MSNQTYSVEITVGVLEKLAGLKKPSKPTRPASSPLSAPPGLLPAAANPEIALLAKGDAQLRRALQSSTRVGQLLLKQEEGEADKVKRYSDDLLKKHSFPIKPMPCEPERNATLECYKQHPEDTLKCAAQVQAYSACAAKAFDEYVKLVASAGAPAS